MKPEVEAHFLDQAKSCRGLGSPFTADLLTRLPGALPDGAAFAERLRAWSGDPLADRAALRAAGALHALARSGRAPALAEAYAAGEAPSPALLAEAIRAGDAFLAPMLDLPPQTNEPARSGALIGGLLIAANETGMEIELLEIGASAGLNLIPDLYAYDFGAAGRRAGAGPLIDCEWRGNAPDPGAPLRIAARAGADLAPIDPAARPSPLIAYLWPDQHARIARAEAALVALAATPWRVERGDAAAWLPGRLSAPQPEGRLRLLMHSIMWDYMPAETRAAIDAAMAAAGARATAARPLARLSMEPDGERGSAALDVTLWPGGEKRRIGRCCFHGKWADWA